jgi:hypothetical protein
MGEKQLKEVMAGWMKFRLSGRLKWVTWTPLAALSVHIKK